MAIAAPHWTRSPGRSGLTRQGLLHYFPSKVTLLMAVLDLGQQDDIALFTRLVEEHRWSLPETLRAIMQNNLSRPGLAQLRTALAGEAINPTIPDTTGSSTSTATPAPASPSGSTREQAQGGSHRRPPERLAMTIVAVIDGLQLQAQLDPDRLDVEQALAELMAVLANA